VNLTDGAVGNEYWLTISAHLLITAVGTTGLIMFDYGTVTWAVVGIVDGNLTWLTMTTEECCGTVTTKPVNAVGKYEVLMYTGFGGNVETGTLGNVEI